MDAPCTILNLFFHQIFAKYRDSFDPPYYNQQTPLSIQNFLILEKERMERNGYGMLAENPIAATKEGGDFTAAPAEVSRRRKPVMKKDKCFIKKKRVSDSDDAYVPPPLPPNITERGRLAFLFYKKLHKSDVNSIGRIVLPKKPAEAHLPVLLKNDSVILQMNDLNTGDEWSFKFRYWPNNRSRMYVLEGTGSFTKKHGLEADDYILLYQDLVDQNYLIRAIRNGYEEEYEKEATEVEGNKAIEKDDANLMNQAVAGGLEFNYNLPNTDQPTNFPNMDGYGGDGGWSLMNDDCDIYFNEIINSFSSSWDDEFMYPPPIQQITSFENLSSEDLSQV
ncbi:B3 domain-containing transcription factor ABI3 [Lactuca sativa]|uniref:B3 domain-containing transcription factor ABI3 n=1 Tax=Lactuca sativa TaxID=4236 RepID=UPI000CC543F0|nr:B3 domain-containing transcription factor ABI3 [Lactuca sativa]